ncbi:unnamed protein product [Fusarium graminearum]|uniref:Chromosome 2, complete genome n=2 Tax=Gibberella zeae TaxID=5518 RepID=A0A098DEG9_GIBZE|nr:unnamed protein product [Fusarium graminearum]CAF3588002.1 unnamed protein product [Fusarium graminearum]CAG2001276.1 unnamed protein product [Fusarium graminearum]CAG2017473.1 unnamed protein product [Fusarium graminearum]CEF77368.1 unnamed protein product [Fusarium graminearum]
MTRNTSTTHTKLNMHDADTGWHHVEVMFYLTVPDSQYQGYSSFKDRYVDSTRLSRAPLSNIRVHPHVLACTQRR